MAKNNDRSTSGLDETLHTGTSETSDAIEYGLDDKPPLRRAIPLGIQHVLAMFLGAVGVPLILSSSIGLSAADTAFIVSMTLFISGVATIVQVYSIGPVGARLPIVMGSTFVFLPAMIDVGNQLGLAFIFGAVIVAAPVEILLGFYIDRIRGLFPPLVTGIVVMLIGLTLMPTGIDYVAGGTGAENYGAPINIGVAAVVFLVALLLNQYLSGILKTASILIGIVTGYVVAVPLGMVDFAGVATASWFAVPMPLQYGISFDAGAIFTFAFLYIVTAMETIGDIAGTTEAVGRDPEPEEMTGGIVADAVMSLIAAVFNTFPNTSFSQNLGVINFTGVASRFVVAIGGIALIILGLVPKIGAIIQAMPDPVLGGGALIMFGMIFATGARIVSRGTLLNQRNLTILAISIGLGLGVDFRPEFLSYFSQDIQLFFGSGIVTGGFTGLILNAILPGSGLKKEEETQQDTLKGTGVKDMAMED